MFKHGERMAVRNHLFLFAWLCATAVPVALQALAGASEDARAFLDTYYGGISLYMFFAMAYGFAAVFVAFYQVSSYHRAGTLDLLRLSGIGPRDVLLGVFLQLELILVPPLLGFAALFAAYVNYLSPDREQLASFGVLLLIGGGVMMLFNQALLAALFCTALYRQEAALILPAVLLAAALNLTSVFAYVLHALWLYLLILTAALVLLLCISQANLARLWPPQTAPRKGV